MFETIKKGCLKLFGNTYFALPIDIKIKGLNIVRYGVKISEIKGKDEIFSYHLSHALDAHESTYAIKDGFARAYAQGNTISNENNLANGMILLTYKNIPFSFGKIVNQTIKNHYPNYLKNKNLKFPG